MSMGIKPEKLFYAPNTVEGNKESVLVKKERNILIFVGSLYEEKGIDVLLQAYRFLIEKKIVMPDLIIIGDGPEKNNIKQFIKENHLENKIKMTGQISDDENLQEYFKKALICISPRQAGLTVQKSFSYGVPMLTIKYPISGGEFTSIMDQVTGFFYDGSVNDMANKLEQIININEATFNQISDNCHQYYERFNSPKIWVANFLKALECK
jgi:glycosyltransferase involved in cell wall biosynthesis